jgi:hypothetical protein
MTLEYKRICRNCRKVIPKDKLSYTGAILINNEWLCDTMCEGCYQVKYPVEYKFLKDSSIKQGKQKQLMDDALIIYRLSGGRKS